MSLKTKWVEDTAACVRSTRYQTQTVQQNQARPYSYVGYKRELWLHDHMRESFPFVRDDQEPDFRDRHSS
jgi:hypothetical protein